MHIACIPARGSNDRLRVEVEERMERVGPRGPRYNLYIRTEEKTAKDDSNDMIDEEVLEG
jgi:hypothetical protein